MGRLLLVVALVAPLAACTSHAARGPAWPKLHEAGSDGGESIAPHEARVPAAAAAHADASSADAPSSDSSPASATPAGDSGADGAAAPATASPGDPSDDTVTVDGVVIDIDD